MIPPGGSLHTRAALEKAEFSDSETYVEEIALLGLVFAEYNYLMTELS